MDRTYAGGTPVPPPPPSPPVPPTVPPASVLRDRIVDLSAQIDRHVGGAR
ncbi:hypothetical protein ACW14Y_42890 [Kitasatospora sp. cg17-2]